MLSLPKASFASAASFDLRSDAKRALEGVPEGERSVAQSNTADVVLGVTLAVHEVGLFVAGVGPRQRQESGWWWQSHRVLLLLLLRVFSSFIKREKRTRGNEAEHAFCLHPQLRINHSFP